MLLKMGIKRDVCSYSAAEWGVRKKESTPGGVLQGRAMLQAKGVPNLSWGECIRTAAFLHNKTPSSAISNKTLYDMLHKKVPDVGHSLASIWLCLLCSPA